MPTIIVNGKDIEIGDAERLNGIQIAARAGYDVPRYCWHPGLSVVASCRMCLVETGTKNFETGQVQMLPKLVPACQTPAKHGTIFNTESDAVKKARAMVEEDLLLRHPVDCPICDKAGECSLQDYHFEHGQSERRADIKPFHSRRRDMGDTVTLFVDRCVMCSRCVRFTREISGQSELMVINRGAHEEIDVFPGYPLDNKMSGNVVDLCPVGALGDKDFLYEQRVWFMQSHDNVCAGCSTGCSIKIDENQDTIYRLKPRENPHINQWWMCDEGRYGFKHVHDPARLTEPRRKGALDRLVKAEWPELPGQILERLEKGKRLAAVLSPHLTVEEAYLLATLIRHHDANALVALGPVPVVGEDEKFKNGFTIRAEKAPNRRGVEAIVSRLMNGKIPTFDDVLKAAEKGEIDGAWITAGYPRVSGGSVSGTGTRVPDTLAPPETAELQPCWIDAATAERLAGLELLIVQDAFHSPLMDIATFQLPGATFAERAGSYVNFADRLQSFTWAIRPPAGVMVEGKLYWQLLRRPGMYNPKVVLYEVASEIGYFSAAAGGPVPATGLDLKVNQLASAT